MTKLSILPLIVAICFIACDPTDRKQGAEHSASTQPVPKVKIAEIEAGIKAYIKEKTNQQDGFFYVHDKEKELRMKLVRVHTEYLSNLGPK
ncbi:MAG TPA: transglutaminase domain-containing protein, partial [Chryseosolibacter sp.]|nr:transglutaminase domain-containing protein [Chryseosolibacter sp.]